MSVQTVSYCLDIRVGYEESYRQELIKFLNTTGEPFGITGLQCGMQQGMKVLRVLTPRAHELSQHITLLFRAIDENEYLVRENEAGIHNVGIFSPDCSSVI